MSLVSAEHITIRHGGATILQDVSFRIGAGEIVTVIGPNGSGKTTLLRAVLGIEKPVSGQVLRQAGLSVGYVPQRLALDRSLPMSVRRFLSLPVRVDDATAGAALARVGVPDIAGRQMADLSGGQLQRTLLARALIGRPALLVLDEPTAGLDQPGEAAFYRLLEEVRSGTGAAVLLVSHDLHVVMAASDRVICLNGHVCCEGTPQVVREAPEYRALFGHGTQGALALYRHDHDHDHDHDHAQPPAHGNGHGNGHDHRHDQAQGERQGHHHAG